MKHKHDPKAVMAAQKTVAPIKGQKMAKVGINPGVSARPGPQKSMVKKGRRG